MLFYRARTSDYLGDGVNPPDLRPSNAALRVTWMIKCFVTGVALLGLAYWLIQIAGAQYLATLTSATLLSFLLVYIVWCLTVKRRQLPQNTESIGPTEPTEFPTASSHLPPTNLTLNPALKHYGIPPRDCSPPPSYDEVLRQMGAAAASAAAAAAAPVPSSSATHSAATQVCAPNYSDVEAPLVRTALQNVASTTPVETSIANETNAILSIPIAEQMETSSQDVDQIASEEIGQSTAIRTSTVNPISFPTHASTSTASAMPETNATSSATPVTTPVTSPETTITLPVTASDAPRTTPTTTPVTALEIPKTTPTSIHVAALEMPLTTPITTPVTAVEMPIKTPTTTPVTTLEMPITTPTTTPVTDTTLVSSTDHIV